MEKSLDKKVTVLLIKAQMCSDSGKGKEYNSFDHPEWKKVSSKWGYDHKEQLIYAACDRISQLHGKSGFSFYFGTDDRLNDVVYFNFKLNNKRHQISFHLPYGVNERYLKSSNKNHHTKWDGKIGGSEEACQLLSDYLYYNK